LVITAPLKKITECQVGELGWAVEIETPVVWSSALIAVVEGM
jgi:hypothetical protein